MIPTLHSTTEIKIGYMFCKIRWDLLDSYGICRKKEIIRIYVQHIFFLMTKQPAKAPASV